MSNTCKIYNNDGDTQVFDTGAAIQVNDTMLKGQRFTINAPVLDYADYPKAFFIAPAACKVVSAKECHATALATTGSIVLEKCNGTKAAGAGDAVLAANFNGVGTAETVQSILGSTGAVATLSAGDRLAVKLSAAGSALAGSTITVVAEYV